MQQEKEKHEPFTGKETGPQGIDKAPGEEPATAPVNFTAESQKGKTVDADVEDESDRPPTKQDL